MTDADTNRSIAGTLMELQLAGLDDRTDDIDRIMHEIDPRTMSFVALGSLLAWLDLVRVNYDIASVRNAIAADAARLAADPEFLANGHNHQHHNHHHQEEQS